MVDTPDGYEEISHKEYERKTRGWSYRFIVFPRKCMETGNWLWLTHAYRGRKVRRYDMDMFYSDEWICKEEFIKLRLLGEV